jgi:hypothetical protein
MQLLEGHLKEPPDDMCTLDHLEPRWHPKRGTFNGHMRIVAACRKCNNVRDKEQLRLIPPELLRAAGSGSMSARELALQHAQELAPIFPVIDPPNGRGAAPGRHFTFHENVGAPVPYKVTIEQIINTPGSTWSKKGE